MVDAWEMFAALMKNKEIRKREENSGGLFPDLTALQYAGNNDFHVLSRTEHSCKK